MEWIADPTVWVGLATLVALEIVLGIDNLVFITILTGRLPPEQQPMARRRNAAGAQGVAQEILAARRQGRLGGVVRQPQAGCGARRAVGRQIVGRHDGAQGMPGGKRDDAVGGAIGMGQIEGECATGLQVLERLTPVGPHHRFHPHAPGRFDEVAGAIGVGGQQQEDPLQILSSRGTKSRRSGPM